MKLNLNKKTILLYAKKYNQSVNSDDKIIEAKLLKWFSKHRYLDRDNFLKLCLWKSRRPTKFYKDRNNSEERIKNITKIAFSTTDEYLRLEILSFP